MDAGLYWVRDLSLGAAQHDLHAGLLAPDGNDEARLLDAAPGLVRRGADGTVRTVDAGDVSHVRTDGAAD